VLDVGEEAEQALALLAEKYEQYRDVPPTAPVLAIDVAEWRGWSADPSTCREGRAGKQSG
jgi:hypothetical protein